MKHRPSIILVLASLFCLHDPAMAGNPWPQLRGPQARGIGEGSELPETWSATENVLWKRELPGRGWSSPIVWGERIVVTTVVNHGESEAPKKGLYFGGDRSAIPTSQHSWKVICLDLQSGEVVWERLAHEGVPERPVHLKNSYASETPVTDGERVYAYFGNLGLFCYDMDGQLLWSQKMQPQATRYDWGTAASPVLHEERIYIVNDNEQQSYLAALDKRTGEQIWRVERDEKSNWATPFIWQNDLRTEIITPGTGKTRAYDLDGKLLYEFGGASSITIATPYSAGGLLYVSSGYIMDRDRPIFAIRPGAAGDITLEADQSSNEYIAWRQNAAAPYNPTTLVYQGLLYVLLDRGLLSCYDAQTGEQIYDRQRLPNGLAFTASPWAYDGKIFCLNEDGVTFVVQAGREFKLLHTNPLAADEMCLATPAIAGNKLLIRSAAGVYCIQSAPR